MYQNKYKSPKNFTIDAILQCRMYTLAVYKVILKWSSIEKVQFSSWVTPNESSKLWKSVCLKIDIKYICILCNTNTPFDEHSLCPINLSLNDNMHSSENMIHKLASECGYTSKMNICELTLFIFSTTKFSPKFSCLNLTKFSPNLKSSNSLLGTVCVLIKI